MVKKLLMIPLFLFLSTLLLSAQGKHEIDVFVGGFQSDFIALQTDGYEGGTLLGRTAASGDLYDLYEPHYSAVSGPVLTLNYHYILHPVFRVGAQLSYGGMIGKKWYRLGSRQQEKYNLHSVAVLPEVKVCIPGMRYFRIYGKAGLGIKLNFGSYEIAPVQFAWEVVPVGAEWGGQRVFGHAELCYGSVIRGGRIGLGFRF